MSCGHSGNSNRGRLTTHGDSRCPRARATDVIAILDSLSPIEAVSAGVEPVRKAVEANAGQRYFDAAIENPSEGREYACPKLFDFSDLQPFNENPMTLQNPVHTFQK